jgi:hypothetical protein
MFLCKRIDDMEEKLMLEVNAANSKIVAETGEEMKAVEKYMSDIQDISHKFDFITKNGSISDGLASMATDPMVFIFDNKFDSLNTSCGKVSDEISFSKSSDFRDKPVSSVFIKHVRS